MTPFQLFGIALCSLFALANLWRLLRAGGPRWPAMLGAALGAVGALTIHDPDMTTRWARTVGIMRGADLLLYLVTLAFLGSWFLYYQKLRTLSEDITRLVRAQALRDVRDPHEAVPPRTTGQGD